MGTGQTVKGAGQEHRPTVIFFPDLQGHVSENSKSCGGRVGEECPLLKPHPSIKYASIPGTCAHMLSFHPSTQL